MRKAFTLIELLVVVTVLPFVMAALSGVYATFIRDIPQTTRVLQENTTVLNLLQQIRRDMDEAIRLPQEFDGQHADDRTLLIEQPGQVIRYQLEDGRIVRTQFVVMPSGVSRVEGVPPSNRGLEARDTHADALTGTLQTGPQPEDRLWRVRDAVIAWRLWVQEGRPYAVEIHSHVKQWVAGFLREKLANTQVFFIRGLAKEGGI
jgi:prepilin-type N-terminal cleavage/methylation domain-containing protein